MKHTDVKENLRTKRTRAGLHVFPLATAFYCVLLNMLKGRFTGVWERALCSLVAVSNVIAEFAASIFRVEECVSC